MANAKILTDRRIPFFDKNTTGIIKGIALIMMFIHHFFTFPSWWGEGISYPLIEKLSPYFCSPLRLCVPIFCFITGYFYFFNTHKTYKYSIKKITDILISYWCVFFVFAIVATVFAEYKYTFLSFIAELFALKRPTMRFCWYVNFYIVFMLLLPVITKLLSRNIHIDLFVCLILIPNMFRLFNRFVNNSIISELIGNQQSWLSCVLIGYIFANYSLFEKIEHLNFQIIKNKKLNTGLMLVGILCIPFGRIAIPSLTLGFSHLPSLYISMDVIYAPLFIYAVVYLCNTIRARIANRLLVIIGNYSLLMWFVSCIFYNNCKAIFQPLLYFPRNPILVTIWGLLLCLSVSFVLEKGIVRIQNCKNTRVVK